MPVRLADIKKRFESVRQLLEAPPLGRDAAPIEIRSAVVDAIESRIAVAGVGRTVFPYNHIIVRLLLPDGDERASFQSVFADLEDKARERLRERRCEVPRTLAVSVAFVRKAPPRWRDGQLFSIDFDTAAEPHNAPAPVSPPILKLAVIAGTATRKAYAFSGDTILIGRTAEATDSKGRVRRNQVAFHDNASTVSRAHARIRYDPSRPGYRVLDDGSARGTWIVRGGRSISVVRDPRGVRLESGDEIHFGEAVVRVTLQTDEDGAATRGSSLPGRG